MRPIGRLFARDVADFARSPALWSLVLIVPLLLLLLIGQLNVRPMVTRVALVAGSIETRNESAEVSAMQRYLRELASVEVFNWPTDVGDPVIGPCVKASISFLFRPLGPGKSTAQRRV